MAGKTADEISVKVASANCTTSSVSPFFNIEVAVDKRLAIALLLSAGWDTCWDGFMPCIKDVSSLRADAVKSSGAAKRNMFAMISRQNEI